MAGERHPDCRAVRPRRQQTDNTTRAVQPALEEILGVNLTIENIGGGSGLIGTAKALKAKPDGYTFSMNPTSTMASIFTRAMPYDVNADVEPVARIARSWLALAVHPDLPIKNVKEFVAYAKANRISYASTGVGGITHIYMELFAQATGIEMTHVPYRGSSKALNALLGRSTFRRRSIPTCCPSCRPAACGGIGYVNNEKMARLYATSDATRTGCRYPAYELVRFRDAQGRSGRSHQRHGGGAGEGAGP